MTMRLSMIVDAGTADAKQNIDQLTGATRELRTTAQSADQQTRKTANSMGVLGRATGGLRRRFAALRAGARQYIDDLRDIDAKQKMTTGSVGNMAAQFNDIGVMLAAGQSPLQLALQQGTQITQILGPMGAAGAVRALGGALMSLVSPISLITVATIGVGAVMFQWLTGASEEVETLEDRIDGLIEKIQAFRKSTQRDDAELEEMFGPLSPELRAMLELGLELDRDRFLDQARKLGRDGAQEILKALAAEGGRSQVLFELLQQSSSRFDTGAVEATRLMERAELQDQIQSLGQIENVEEQLSAVKAIRNQISGTRDDQGELNETQKEFLRGLGQIEAALAQVVEANRQEQRAAEEKFRKRMEYYAASRVASDQALAAADAEITKLEQELALRDAIRLFGEGSVEVAELRLAAERRAYEATVDAMDISEELKSHMMATWDAANGVADADIAGNVGLAANEALRLTQNLMAARGAAMMGLIRQNPDFHDPRGGTVGSRGAGNPDYIYREQILPPVIMPPNPRNPGRRGGGGSGAIEQQRKAVTELIAELHNELAVLRETDPVQKEMLRLREQMVGATDEQKQTISDLVAQRVAETAQIEAQQSAYDHLISSISTGFSDIISGADSVSDAFKNIAASILDATIQAQLFGNGPLAGVFGTSNSGGLIGSLVGGLFPALAQQSTPVGPALTMSAMQADLASRPNAPMQQAYATRAAMGSSEKSRTVLEVNINATGVKDETQMEEAAYRGLQRAMDERIEQFSRLELPPRLNQLRDEPWRR